MVELKPGVPLDVEKLRAAIQKAGYDTREFEVVLRARVAQEGDALLLRPAGGSQTFAVAGGKEKLAGLVGHTVTARGRVKEESDRLAIEVADVTPEGK